MERTHRRWACGLLAALLVLLGLCAAAVYAVDPCMYYRMPERWQPVFFNERYQAAGIARNVPADTVLIGTSMAANYQAAQISNAFGGSAVRITIPDGYFSEFDMVMGTLFRSQTPERVIFLLDANILIRDESGVTDALPGYLYNANPLDDVKYLLNKDTLYYSLYVLMTNRWGGGQTLDEGFAWDQDVWWNHMEALANYTRPEIEDEKSPDIYAPNVSANLAVVENWITSHPNTEFDIVLPPYSILAWDKYQRLGQTKAVIHAVDQACDTLLAYQNVKLYGYLVDSDIVENLDYYCDYVHHSGQVCEMVLERICLEKLRLTAENRQEILACWQDFVENYDYEKFWQESFWWAWNDTHPAAPAETAPTEEAA